MTAVRSPRQLADQVRQALDYPTAEAQRPARVALAELVLRLEQTEEALLRVLFIAEHLFQMVPTKVWRDSGGDDGQGHYEGDYYAEKVADELAGYRAALSSQEAKP